MYVEDVIVHLSSAAAECVGYLNLTADLVASQTLYGHRVEVLPTGWVRVYIRRDGDEQRSDKGDVWLAPGQVIALTRMWNADTEPPGGKDAWEAGWGTFRGEGQ